MQTLSRDQYTVAVQGWAESKADLRRLEELFPVNSIFKISAEQVQWLKEINTNKEFCAEIGVIEKKLAIILCPLDERGNRVEVDEHAYSLFETLEEDLKLTEIQTYTVIKNSILSKDFRKIDNDSDVFFPVVNKPIMDQEKAVDSIEIWQNEGLDWFYAEFKQNNSKNIFNKFYVPADKLDKAEEFSYICSFGFKFSEIYQKQLPALIFIAFPKNLGNGSIETISNTYDWAKPCPPICKIPDGIE